MKKTIVIALGGNALGKTPEEQLELVKKTAKNIVDLIEAGNNVVITHGNGPQVGMINLAMEESHKIIDSPEMPFAECGAMSQGYIGYHLQQSIQEELAQRNIKKNCVTVITQVEVDKNDKAFENPTKPIGSFYTKEEAQKLEKEKGYCMKEDAGRGYRRVVASPKPIKIVEIMNIHDLVEDGNVVIACGGGGIPVIKTKEGYEGVDAVIDKDRTSARLALDLNADALLILTAVDQVYLNYKKENQKALSELTIRQAANLIKNKQVAEGSMLPKVEACIEYAKASDGYALITSLEKAKEALEGQTGTIIRRKRRKKMAKRKKKFSLALSSFTIIILLIFLLGILSHILPKAKFIGDTIVNGSGVVGAKLSDVLLSPILGFGDAVDVGIFIMILGGFLAVINSTGALETGIQVLVKKLKGNELALIPILMFIFSVCGSTYGMLEETVGFYALLAATMVAAGMDTIVASAIVLLGAGSGCLGSTINPFAVGAAVSALPEGTVVNQGIIIFIGTLLWLSTLAISIYFVMNYAKKVKADKGSTILSLREQQKMEKKYGKEELDENVSLNGKQKVTLILFALTFLIMIIGFIPWGEFGINFFDSWTGWLTGSPLGSWYFNESALWFLIMAVIIGIANGMKEKKFVDTFVDGADDMVGVILIIAVARGASVLMKTTHLDNYIIYNAADLLKNVPGILFTPLNYLIHIILSVLVPSSSGLATLSAPIIGPLAAQLGHNVEATVMTLVAANGLVNLITPTCGAIMGGLALAKVEYSTWVKWAWKVVLTIAIANILLLTLFTLVF